MFGESVVPFVHVCVSQQWLLQKSCDIRPSTFSLQKLKHEADLAQKLHAQTSKEGKKTPTPSVYSTVNKRTPASVEIVSVVSGKSSVTSRYPLKVVNVDRNRVSKGSEKASSIVISSDESDECPLPDNDKAAVEADRNPKAHPEPPPPSSTSVSSHKSKISSLVKSIKKTMKETFAPKSKSVRNDANQNVNPKQPLSRVETKSSHGQSSSCEVSGPTSKTAPSSETTTKPGIVAHPLMNTVKVGDTRSAPLASSSQTVATNTVTTQSAPTHPHITGVSKKSALKPITYMQGVKGQRAASTCQPKPSDKKFSLRPPPAPPRDLPPVQPTHSNVAYTMPTRSSYHPSSNAYSYPQYNQQQQYRGRYGEVVPGQGNQYHGYQQANQYHGYQQADHYHQYQQANQQYQHVNHQYQQANQHHQYNYPYQTNAQY